MRRWPPRHKYLLHQVAVLSDFVSLPKVSSGAAWHPDWQLAANYSPSSVNRPPSTPATR